MRRFDAVTALIPFVYFIAGATSLAGVATTFFYKDDLHLSVSQVQMLASFAIVPWSIKPVYGLFSDRFPLWRMRRKPYLFVAGLAGCAGYMLMATVVQDFRGALFASILSALGFALADVIVDGIVVERSRNQSEAGKLQSICRGALMLGALLVAYASGILVEQIGARKVFYITGALPLLTSAFAFILREQPSAATPNFSIKQTWCSIRSAITPSLLWSALFLFLWRATPTSGSAFSYFLIDELSFDPEFFGRLSLVSNITSIIAIVFFRKFLLSISLRRLLVWVVILSVLLSLPSFGLLYGWYKALGVSPQFFAVADTAVGGVLQEIGFLPLLVLAARVCPKGVEATMFALLASLMNIGLAVSDMGGAWLTTVFRIREATDALPGDYSNLHLVVWIAVLSSFLPLLLLPWLPETRTEEESVSIEPSPSGETPQSPIADRDKRLLA